MTQSDSLLSLPKRPGHMLFETDSMMGVQLMRQRQFMKYCKDRDLTVTRDRLRRFEVLGVFRPIVRMFERPGITDLLSIPGGPVSEWIEAGALVDTYDLATDYDVPEENDERSEAYYSIFQIDQLSLVLNEMTLEVQLDSYLGDDQEEMDWNTNAARWLTHAEQRVASWQSDEVRRAIPILCQYLANRYYFRTQGNGRMINVSKGNFGQDQWVTFNTGNWDWWAYSRSFDPKDVEARFELTPQKLRHAYNTLSLAAQSCDPLEKWANLVEFVSLDRKKRLKGKALRAVAFRDAANMLRLFYKDLYEEELPPTHQVYGEVLNHFPELEAREDTRRHLEYVVNQYDLNPQPKLVLFVEGQSEMVMIGEIFKSYYGHHPGRLGIELVNLKGVNNATGNKKEDRFRAIIRLVDYLHHHQTMTFLILDRENFAEKLQAEAKKAKSLHGQGRLAVPAEHIALWDLALEFDNFSNTEIARAMTELSDGRAKFKSQDIKGAREADNPGGALSVLYKAETDYKLNKPSLARHLAAILVDPNARRAPENRPIVKLLDKVRLRAGRNPFPTRKKSWETNQSFGWLGGPKKPKSKP